MSRFSSLVIICLQDIVINACQPPYVGKKEIDGTKAGLDLKKL